MDELKINKTTEDIVNYIGEHWRDYINVDRDGMIGFVLWRHDFTENIKNILIENLKKDI